MNVIGRGMWKFLWNSRTRSFCSHPHFLPGDVTKQNFWRSLDSFRFQLQSADFVAFDLELSGIHGVPREDHFAIDPTGLERAYWRLKHLAEKFAVFQVGVALFELDRARGKFISHPYNFYLFPRDELSLGLPASTFSCEASSLEFLASHGFNFNLCFQDGISYLSKTQEAEARFRLVSECGPPKVEQFRSTTSLSSTSDVIFFEKLRVELGKWRRKLKSCSLDWNSLGQDEIHLIKTSADISGTGALDGFQATVPRAEKLSGCQILGGRPSFTLQLENPHQVCLAQQVLDKHFQDLVPVVRIASVPSPPLEITIIFTSSREDLVLLKNGLEKGSNPSQEVLINEAIGFRHVIDALVMSRKPVVGHNCALDLAHIYSKFIAPLPTTAAEFSASLLDHFPYIIDTKYLMKFEQTLRASWARRHTSLNAVYSYLCKPKDVKVGAARFARSLSRLSQKVQIEIMTGFKRYQDADGNLLHEAGYDAFMTGSVFAQICHLLHVDVKTLQFHSRGKAEKSAGIAEHMNLLNLGHMALDLRAGKATRDGKSEVLCEKASSKFEEENLDEPCCAEV